MAINPGVKYLGNVTPPNADYPYASAKNVTAPSTGDGTPLDKDWVNDWFGFQQAILSRASIVPSGVPDTALSSDILTGLIRVVGGSSLLSSTAITAVTDINLPTIFTDNPGYKYFKIVVEDFGNSTTGANRLVFSKDGATFAVADAVELGTAYLGSHISYANVLMTNAASATNHKAGTGNVFRFETAGGSSSNTAISQIIGDAAALTGFKLTSGGFRAIGFLKVYGSNVPF